MNDATPSLKQLNRTFIGSVLFIDIVGYSKRTVPDQLAMKELFNDLLAEAVQNVAPSERIMVDTGDGAAIAFLGDPEDALFAALSLRDAVDTGKVTVGEPGFVRMGINLGPLKMVRDINGHTNMIGDGVNDAQRVMSFAESGQVMVSHSYYDIISRFSRDYSQLFVYEGTRHDKHVREHEVYRFGPIEDNEILTEKLRDRSRARQNAACDPVSSGTKAPQNQSTPHPQKRTASRFGLVATAIGAVSLVGAVWSWTGTPTQKAEGISDLPPAAPPLAAVAGSPDAQPAKPEEAKSKSVDKAADKKPSAKEPETQAAKEKAKPPAAAATAVATVEKTATDKDKTEEKPAKKADNADSVPAKPGTVKLAVQPWGEVYVDGSKRGISPPLKSLSLAPGKHRIEIRNGQFAPHKETIEVKSGAESTIRYVF